MDRPEIILVKLSDSFIDVWDELAGDLGAGLALRETAEIGQHHPIRQRWCARQAGLNERRYNGSRVTIGRQLCLYM